MQAALQVMCDEEALDWAKAVQAPRRRHDAYHDAPRGMMRIAFGMFR